MKYINSSTRTLVDFTPGGEAIPIYFLYQNRRIKIDRVLDKKQSRKAFNNCIIYRCQCRDRLLELRWDRDKDRWYIDKMEIINP